MTIIIAHRGASAYALENSLSAIEKAVSLGADFIEVDVRPTKDKKPILMHDPRLEKTTNACGYVHDYRLCDLEKYRMKTNEKIPTLEDAISVFPEINATPRFKIDVKESGLEEEVYRILLRHKLLNSVIITSEDICVLKRFRKMDSALLLELGGLKKGMLLEKLLKKALKYRVNFLAPHRRIVTKKLVKLAHAYGLRVDVWTVNDIKTALELVKMGCDAITTDKPDIIRKALLRLKFKGRSKLKSRLFKGFS